MGGESVDFLGKARLFVPIYVISSLWQHTGWSSIIYIAALSGVDLELHDAAQIDGANLVQRIWHINLPCILPTAVIMFVLSCGHIMSVGYEKIYLMQNSINLSISEVISTYVYKVGLIKVQFSYTTAIGLFNNVINVALLLLSNYMARKLTDERPKSTIPSIDFVVVFSINGTWLSFAASCFLFSAFWLSLSGFHIRLENLQYLSCNIWG